MRPIYRALLVALMIATLPAMAAENGGNRAHAIFAGGRGPNRLPQRGLGQTHGSPHAHAWHTRYLGSLVH